MSKQARRKGSQAARARQQQEAAARRRGTSQGAGRAGGEPPSTRQAGTARQAPAASAGSRVVHHYLDISAVRIQDWLSRTPDLRFRRGASVLLAEATARDAWEGTLPPGMRWNDEAGGVDGVVSLVLEAPVSGEDDSGSLERAAWAVAQRMREIMPCCPVQAVAGTGENYAAAYADMTRDRRDGRILVDSPPVPPEVVLAKPCDQCRSAAAVHPIVKIIAQEDPKDLCRDCHRRFEAAGGTKGDRVRRSPLPERRMKEALARSGAHVTGFSDDFATMAAAGREARDDASTQIALIYADGNRVGSFLSEAASQARTGGRPGKDEIVPAIDQATVGALADAVIDRFSGWSRPPVLANLAGGDDLLVSVPAIDAWLFVRTLLDSFSRRIGEAASGWPRPVQQRLPSLSAGLVFHHAKAPFSDLVRLAEDQLVKAKQEGHGQVPAVAFLDLTADGGHEPEGRTPLTLRYLDQQAGRLKRIEEIPKSRRAVLRALLRQQDPAEFIRRLTDLDNEPLWEVAVGRPDADAPATRDVLARHPEKLDELRRILDVARHWRSAPRSEPEAEAVA